MEEHKNIPAVPNQIDIFETCSHAGRKLAIGTSKALLRTQNSAIFRRGYQRNNAEGRGTEKHKHQTDTDHQVVADWCSNSQRIIDVHVTRVKTHTQTSRARQQSRHSLKLQAIKNGQHYVSCRLPMSCPTWVVRGFPCPNRAAIFTSLVFQVKWRHIRWIILESGYLQNIYSWQFCLISAIK